REAGYHGAGTVEFLVGEDGTISFLEVNTRLQVEHPVSEETAGVDLVREQFRIAAGEPLRFTQDPTPRGHAIEFRINGEDAGRNFLPAPGTVTTWIAPEGPGVRVDSGVESGSVIGGAFDSLLAKVIIVGEDRTQALERARRALDELVVTGMATVLPFHRAVVRDPAFIGDEHGFTVHTRWIETEFDNTIPPFEGAAETEDDAARQTVVVEVGGRRLEVTLPGDLSLGGGGGPAAGAAKPRKRSGTKSAAAVSGDAVAAPMQGTIVKVAVADGQQVAAGELVVVLEAMKMENPVTAHKAGTVTGLAVAIGDAVTQGSVLLEIQD
ncbi:MAG TPA: biotin/lipoyl-containing protein, partial [Mycobacteriales bacterium]|nr:biotin/lipoyl-containing protein [Mycobacteriales bacterium]